MKTKYFTFGQTHIHRFNGVTLDKDVVVKITDENPREKMHEFFGVEWAFEYERKPKMVYFHRGIFNINTSEFE